MEQSSIPILTLTRLENLLKHYDINDLVEFLAKKKFLLISKVKYILSSKQEAIKYIASSDKFHSNFFQVFEQYRAYVSKDVKIALAEIKQPEKLPVKELQQQSPLESESESDSFSQSSFSDEPDTGFNMHSQTLPTVSLSKFYLALIMHLCVVQPYKCAFETEQLWQYYKLFRNMVNVQEYCQILDITH